MLLKDKKFIFVIGATRSGTSWLHNIFQQHASVATEPKLEIKHFNNYVIPWLNQWKKEKGNIEKYNWKQGLPCLWHDEEFLQFIHSFIEKVYLSVLKNNEQASHIVDKNPGYSLITHEIAALVPNAKFIHIIRDGRDAVSSMRSLHTRRGFGGENIHAAASNWNKLVNQARNAETLGTEKYLEIRYEQLFADTEKELVKIFKFCELKSSPEEIRRIVSTTSIDKSPVSSGNRAIDHLRSQKDAIWKSQLSLKDRYIFNSIAGDTLLKLGYTDSKDWWIENTYHRLYALVWKAKKKFKIIPI